MLLAAGLAAAGWGIVLLLRSNTYTALANLALALTGLGAAISAYHTVGIGVSSLSLILAIAWSVIASVLALASSAVQHEAPIVLRVLDDFEFERFLSVALAGLLWALSLAGGLWLVFYGLAHSLEQGDSRGKALLVALILIVPVFLALLIVRLALETSVVLFRIYGRLGTAIGQPAASTGLQQVTDPAPDTPASSD